jgi:hypothetical protein
MINVFYKLEIVIISILFSLLSISIMFINNDLYYKNVLSGVIHFKEVIFFLAVISILKELIRTIKWDKTFSSNNVTLYTIMFSFTFGLATPVLMKRLFSNKNASITNLTRLVCISMFIFPTTVASSFLYDKLHPNMFYCTTFGLMLLPIIFYVFNMKLSYSTKIVYILMGSILSVSIIFFIKHIFIISLLLSQTYFYIILMIFLLFFMDRSKNIDFKNIVREIASNMILFISMGLFAVSLMNAHIDLKFNNVIVAAIFLVVIFPSITILFIHPLALFSILGPSINNCLDGFLSNNQLYVLWVLSFILAQLCSPSSIASILAAQHEKKSILTVSFYRHIFFCIKLAGIVIICVCVWILMGKII